MDFIIEILFEIIIEGSMELGSSKKVPLPLRILAAILILVIYLGMGGWFIYTAYTEVTGTIQIVLYAVGFFIFLGGIYMIYKMIKRKQRD